MEQYSNALKVFYIYSTERFQNSFAPSGLLKDRITLHFFKVSVMLLQTRSWYIKRPCELPRKVIVIQVLVMNLKGRTKAVQQGPQENFEWCLLYLSSHIIGQSFVLYFPTEESWSWDFCSLVSASP